MSQRTDTGATTITRREFTLESALALLSTVAISVSSCGGNGYSSPTTPSSTPTPTPSPTPGATPSNVTGAISANHGHSAVITGAQISGGGGFTLDITGTATHTHTV